MDEVKGVKTFTLIITTLAISILGIVYCSAPDQPNGLTSSKKSFLIKESFHTQRDESNNVDSPALWHGPEGQNWLLATAKEGNAIIVFEAATGEKITSFGQTGSEAGDLLRPNGIAVIDNLALIVERDNRRVQVFSLPDFEPLGYFGDDQLRKPYGIAIDQTDDGYELYVTDNYEMSDESIPPVDSLGQRVHHFSFIIEQKGIMPKHIKAFGDTKGEGILYKVESILLDRELDRLLIADEYEMQRNIKIYTPDGNFTGEIIPHKYFNYEPEGIALWACDGDTSGYYITTDQDVLNNYFSVFERKTLKYRGRFAGEITRNTDGIALTQKSFGDFSNGAFYPVHDDGSITAIGWEAIADSLKLRRACN